MSLGKQTKTLNKSQIKMIGEFLLNNRYGLRDQKRSTTIDSVTYQQKMRLTSTSVAHRVFR